MWIHTPHSAAIGRRLQCSTTPYVRCAVYTHNPTPRSAPRGAGLPQKMPNHPFAAAPRSSWTSARRRSRFSSSLSAAFFAAACEARAWESARARARRLRLGEHRLERPAVASPRDTRLVLAAEDAADLLVHRGLALEHERDLRALAHLDRAQHAAEADAAARPHLVAERRRRHRDDVADLDLERARGRARRGRAKGARAREEGRGSGVASRDERARKHRAAAARDEARRSRARAPVPRGPRCRPGRSGRRTRSSARPARARRRAASGA